MPDNPNKISSPEQLNSYIRAASPGAWIILTSAAIFLLGLFTWLFFGELSVNGQTIKPLTFLLK
ncbi:MAG: hypothetical protein IJT02_03285 [Synergistaceae bacterium]|nr:hypothetical protein [Synergistaceae bacterium]